MNVNSTTTDPVKGFLASVAEARIEERRLRLRVKRLETQAMKLTASLTGMPRGNGDSGNLLASLADMRIASEKAIVEAEKTEERVAAFIEKLSNPTSRIILKLRYCDCLDWTDRPHQRSVTSELRKAGLYYSDRHLYRLHGIALNEARELYYKENGNEQNRDS